MVRPARRHIVPVACICLALLISTPATTWVYWGTLPPRKKGILMEPSELYFFDPASDNGPYAEVWNATKQLDEMSELSKHGNYSVLIYSHFYQLGSIEEFAVASTLQPDSSGFIYELALRIDPLNFSLVKSYRSVYRFNPTSVENGKGTMEDFLVGNPIGYATEPSDYHSLFPFLILFNALWDPGITIILNLETGKIMISATMGFLGSGRLVFPEYAIPTRY